MPNFLQKVWPIPLLDLAWKAHRALDSPLSKLSKFMFMGVDWFCRNCLPPFSVSQRDHTAEPWFSNQDHVVTPCSTVTILYFQPGMNFLFCIDHAWPYILLWILQCLLYLYMNCLIFSTNFQVLEASPTRSALTPPCYPHVILKGEGGKYLKQVTNGDLPTKVWTSLL